MQRRKRVMPFPMLECDAHDDLETLSGRTFVRVNLAPLLNCPGRDPKLSANGGSTSPGRSLECGRPLFSNIFVFHDWILPLHRFIDERLGTELALLDKSETPIEWRSDQNLKGGTHHDTKN